jgi:hypothetical protein
VTTPEPVRRRWPVVALVAALAGALGAGAGQWYDARARKAEVEALRAFIDAREPRDPRPLVEPDLRARAEAERYRAHLARYDYARTIQHAHRLWEANQIGAARTLLEATPAELRGWEYGYVYHLCSPGRARATAEAGAAGSTAPRSPDGTKVLALDGIVVRVRDAATGADLFELRGHRAAVRAAAWSADGARVATVADDGTARVWDATTGAELLALPGADEVAFSADGHSLFTRAFGDGAALIYDNRPGTRPVFRVPVAPPPRPAAP